MSKKITAKFQPVTAPKSKSKIPEKCFLHKLCMLLFLSRKPGSERKVVCPHRCVYIHIHAPQFNTQCCHRNRLLFYKIINRTFFWKREERKCTVTSDPRDLSVVAGQKQGSIPPWQGCSAYPEKPIWQPLVSAPLFLLQGVSLFLFFVATSKVGKKGKCAFPRRYTSETCFLLVKVLVAEGWFRAKIITGFAKSGLLVFAYSWLKRLQKVLNPKTFTYYQTFFLPISLSFNLIVTSFRTWKNRFQNRGSLSNLTLVTDWQKYRTGENLMITALPVAISFSETLSSEPHLYNGFNLGWDVVSVFSSAKPKFRTLIQHRSWGAWECVLHLHQQLLPSVTLSKCLVTAFQ